MNGEVIAGLYCGGESAGGFSLHGLARCSAQGVIAGRNAHAESRAGVADAACVPVCSARLPASAIARRRRARTLLLMLRCASGQSATSSSCSFRSFRFLRLPLPHPRLRARRKLAGLGQPRHPVFPGAAHRPLPQAVVCEPARSRRALSGVTVPSPVRAQQQLGIAMGMIERNTTSLSCRRPRWRRGGASAPSHAARARGRAKRRAPWWSAPSACRRTRRGCPTIGTVTPMVAPSPMIGTSFQSVTQNGRIAGEW